MDQALKKHIYNYLKEFNQRVPATIRHIPTSEKFKRVIVVQLWRSLRFSESISALHQGVSQLVAIGLIRPIMEMLIDALFLSIKRDNSLAERYSYFEVYDWFKNGLIHLLKVPEVERKESFKAIKDYYQDNRKFIETFIKKEHRSNLSSLLNGQNCSNDVLENIYNLLKANDWRPNTLHFELMVKEIDTTLKQEGMNEFMDLYRFYYKFTSSGLHSSPTDAHYYIEEHSYKPTKDHSDEGMALSALPGIYRCFQIAAFKAGIFSEQDNRELHDLWKEIPGY